MRPWLTVVFAGCLLAAGNSYAQNNSSSGVTSNSSTLSAQIDSLVNEINNIKSVVNDQLKGLDERQTTSENDLVGLKKLKVSGYIQARYEYLDYENFKDGAKTTNKYGVASTSINGSQGQSDFYIRRGRLKFTYTPSKISEYVIYFDASKNTVSLKEAYVKLTEPWTGKSMANLTFGQMNWPFGIEIERSSSVREVPERTLLENTLFNGERDRGAKVTLLPTKGLKVDLGIFNGWGINNSTYTWQDPTKQKDFIGRVKYDLGFLAVTGSYYNGESYVANSSTTTLKSKVQSGSSPDTTVTKTEHRYYKGRIGAGVEGYYQILPIGGTALLAEYVKGDEFGKDVSGGYVLLVQNLNKKLGLAFRAETYDADNNYKYKETYIFTPSLNFWWDEATRITLAYDDIHTNYDGFLGKKDSSVTKADPRDNKLTLQFQLKF